MSVTLTPEQLAHLAKLARLELSPAESSQLAHELPRILGFVAQLAEVDTTGIAPMAHPQEAFIQLRADQAVAVSEAFTQAVLAQAPAAEAGLFLVPRVIE